jgi:hypothetical protein
MTFLYWTRASRTPARSARPCRPQVEALDERLTPSFTSTVPAAVGMKPVVVAVADFNGDGKLDFAVVNQDSGTVSIRLGNGAGTFTAKPDIAVAGFLRAVAVGDFNGDSKPDLAVSTDANANSGNVSIRLGNGAGTFTAKPDVAVGEEPVSFVVADFNGDGKTDLASVNSGSNTVSVGLGNGDGTFTAKPDFDVGMSTNSLEGVAAADFNGDGKLDLAISIVASGTVSIRPGTGLGTFLPGPDIFVGTAPFFTAVADFNGDGKPDLAVANILSGTVSIRPGTGDFTFTAKPDVVVGKQPFSVAVGDFNGDGKQDLVVANAESNNVSVRLGNGGGTFAAEPDIVGSQPASVAVGDFNGDGKQDLAVANGNGNNVTVLLNTFPSPLPHPSPTPAPIRSAAQIVAVAFRQKGIARVRVKDAATGALRGVLTPFKGFGGRLRLQLQDVNGDGSLDLIVQATIHGKRRKKLFDAVTLAPLPPGLV